MTGAHAQDPDERPSRGHTALDLAARSALRTGKVIGELVGEAVLHVAACLALAGAAAAVWWGWNQHPETTIAVTGCIVAFLLYGAWNLMRSGPVRWSRLAAAASACAAVVGLLLSYLPSCSCI